MVAPKDIRSYYLEPVNVTLYDQNFVHVIEDLVIDYRGGP